MRAIWAGVVKLVVYTSRENPGVNEFKVSTAPTIRKRLLSYLHKFLYRRAHFLSLKQKKVAHVTVT